jgi:hypothetical protein
VHAPSVPRSAALDKPLVCGEDRAMWRLLALLAACSDGSRGPEVECGAPGEQIRLPSDEPEGCTHVLGSVHVPDATDANTLASLRTVRRIDGDFFIFRPHALENLAGLGSLEEVGGVFSVRLDIGSLVDLRGVELLREVGSLEISNNSSLQSLRGLDRLELVRGDAAIVENGMLHPAEIDSLVMRMRVDGELRIEANGGNR